MGAPESPATGRGAAPPARPRRGDAFTELIAAPHLSASLLAFAALVAAALGALHALEPGHGKTVVAAYLVGSRGTAKHALVLGLIVTASHTAGVYLLGGATLYASRYVLPERLYPWLALASGLTIAGLGLTLLFRRGTAPHHHHGHAHEFGGHDHGHPHAIGGHGGDDGQKHGEQHQHHGGGHAGHAHAGHEHAGHEHAGYEHAAEALGRDAHHGHAHGGHAHRHDHPHGVSPRELVALGITGGIVPCPAALVVLLSAVSLHRIGFGLFLIVAFSLGLAAVLIAIGVLMVHARALMSRWHGDGPLLTRWLPLTSSAVITILGAAIALQALGNTGIVPLRLG